MDSASTATSRDPSPRRTRDNQLNAVIRSLETSRSRALFVDEAIAEAARAVHADGEAITELLQTTLASASTQAGAVSRLVLDMSRQDSELTTTREALALYRQGTRGEALLQALGRDGLLRLANLASSQRPGIAPTVTDLLRDDPLLHTLVLQQFEPGSPASALGDLSEDDI